MMKIEYLEDGSDDCPLLRLYGFERDDVVALHNACIALAEGRLKDFRVDGQTWAQSIDDGTLILRCTAKNRGSRMGKTPTDPLAMELNADGWREVAERIEPFLADLDGYTWLNDEGDFNVLLSQTGQW